MTHLFVCTGEVSGDLQASYLIKTLRQQRPDLTITAVGGERMAEAGAHLLHRTTDISSIGIIEALPFIGPALWTEWKIRRFLARTQPDLCLLVDYIGVNSRVSGIMQQRRIPMIYYIAPQEWVWSSNALLSYQLAERMRLMLAIFPEEARHYAEAGGNVRWVGHPLIDILQHAPSRELARHHLQIPPHQTAVMLFPASRKQELHHIVPILFQAAQQLQAQLPQVKFWLPLVSSRFARLITQQADRYGVSITLLDSHNLADHHWALAAADLVLAKSGTVNLEAAILGIPQVVVYRVSRLTYWIGRHILKFTVPFISPPNLVMMREIIPEFLQDRAQPEILVKEALDLLINPQRQAQLRQDYHLMKIALGQPGVLTRATTEILKILDQLDEQPQSKTGTRSSN